MCFIDGSLERGREKSVDKTKDCAKIVSSTKKPFTYKQMSKIYAHGAPVVETGSRSIVKTKRPEVPLSFSLVPMEREIFPPHPTPIISRSLKRIIIVAKPFRGVWGRW